MTRISISEDSPWLLFAYRSATLLLMGAGLWLLWSESSFFWGSETTNATITSGPVQFRTGGRRTRHYEYRFGYEFTVAGQTYTGRASTRAYPSQVVTVYYERANPANNRAKPPRIWLGVELTGLGLVGFFIKPWRLFKRHETRAAA